MSDDLKFKHPFTSIVSGPTGSGKSSFCMGFLQNLYSCTEQNFDGGIIWCYSESTAVPWQQLATLSKNVFMRACPTTSTFFRANRPLSFWVIY
jgi:GTPase SAR1 family protein